MNYKIIYSKKQNDFNKSKNREFLKNIGNWRSRWERKAELDKKKGFYIDEINTRPTDKDYIFVDAYGYDANKKLYFKIVPADVATKEQRFKKRTAVKCTTVKSKHYGKKCPAQPKKSKLKGKLRAYKKKK